VLEDVLYANSRHGASESGWLELVRSIAAGNAAALHALYRRTHRLVFTLLMRITSNRQVAEEVAVDVYGDLLRRAATYDPAHATVLGWVMNQARFRAIARLRRENRGAPVLNAGLLAIDTPDYGHLLQMKEQTRALRDALAVLTADERTALETAHLAELTCVEVAARSGQSAAAVKTLIRSALHKLRDALMDPAKAGALDASRCDQGELACCHAVDAVPADEAPAVEDHLATCWQCRREQEALRPVIDSLVMWPTDVLRPPASLPRRFAQRFGVLQARHASQPMHQWLEPAWEDVAPGIACKLLATDAERQRISMLVRLAPGGAYPPHTHAGVEELHLLDGELWIDDRKLHAGDYNHAEPGTGDKRVWSETGCACVLVTSTRDILG